MPRAFFKSQFFKSQNHVLNHLAYLHAQSPLFSGTSNIPLETAQQMVSTFDKPCKWWFVFSLNRTDADRLQIDRGYFQQLLESQKAIWAKAYNIPPERLHIYASYHDLDHHPHVHVVLHGEHPSDGYVVCRNGQSLGDAFKHCRQTVKSSIANEIFRADSETLKKDHSQQRQELNKELDRLLLEIGHSSHPIHPDIQRSMQQLSTQLAALPGKHVYGYLPANLKQQVDNLLEEAIKKDTQLAGMFETYKTTHRTMIDHLYVDSPITLDQKMAAWENKFFHPAKGDDTRRHNIILQAAEALAAPARERNKKTPFLPLPGKKRNLLPLIKRNPMLTQMIWKFFLSRTLEQRMNKTEKKKIFLLNPSLHSLTSNGSRSWASNEGLCRIWNVRSAAYCLMMQKESWKIYLAISQKI